MTKIRKKNIIFSLVLICFLIMVTGCNEKRDYKEEQSKIRQKLSDSRMEKMSIIDQSDGWYYYFMITSIAGEESLNTFGGCNLKYTELDGYNITISDQDGKIISELPSQPTLAISDKSKDGVKERDEVRIIDDYFDNKGFNNFNSNIINIYFIYF